MSKSRICIILFFTMMLLAVFTTLAMAKGSVTIIDGNKAIKGKLAPRFEMLALDGQTISTEALRDNKCIVIDFWATWCTSCKKELPYLQKFYEKYKDSCLVIGVSKDEERARKVLENQIKELKLTFPNILDPKEKIRKTLFPGKGIPLMVVINRKGEVVEMKYGAMKPEKIQEILEKLLGDDLKIKAKEEVKTEKETGEKSKEEVKEKPEAPE